MTPTWSQFKPICHCRIPGILNKILLGERRVLFDIKSCGFTIPVPHYNVNSNLQILEILGFDIVSHEWQLIT